MNVNILLIELNLNIKFRIIYKINNKATSFLNKKHFEKFYYFEILGLF